MRISFANGTNATTVKPDVSWQWWSPSGIGLPAAILTWWRHRIVLVFATTIYIVAFQISYRDFVAPQQGAWGAGYQELSLGLLTLIYAMCIFPSLWMPIAFRRPSQLLFYIQYYLVFIPSAFAVFYVIKPTLKLDEAVELLLWMSFGLMVLQATYALPLAKFRIPRIAPSFFWTVIGVFSIFLFAYLITILHSNFQLVGLAQIYELRAAMGDILAEDGGNALAAYVQLWLGNLILPLLFAVAVFSRRWILIPIVFLGYLFIFGVSGQKASLLAMVYLPGFYWLLRLKYHNTPAIMAAAFTLVLLFVYALAVLSPLGADIYTAIVNFRVFSIQGLNLAQYYAFFQDHPRTYFSHLAGIRWFVRYPYDLDIPHTLGYYYYDAPVGNNSGMWASDGIASVGLWGIPFISACAAIVFWLLDSCSRLLNPRFVAVTVTYIGATFANVSLGTTFISGGLAFLCLIVLILPRSGRFSRYYVSAHLPSSPLHGTVVMLPPSAQDI